MGGIISPPKPKDPTPPPEPPEAGDEDVEAERRAELKRRARAAGRATLLTGGEGVTETANTGRATLLGG